MTEDLAPGAFTTSGGNLFQRCTNLFENERCLRCVGVSDDDLKGVTSSVGLRLSEQGLLRYVTLSMGSLPALNKVLSCQASLN